MTYHILAQLYSGSAIPASCDPDIIHAVTQYNAVPRANGKQLQASRTPTGDLQLTLYTHRSVAQPLVAAQGFSKLLSLTPSFAPYIRPGRLLAQT